MIMRYNFFVGMCSRCSELIQFLAQDICYNIFKFKKCFFGEFSNGHRDKEHISCYKV